MNACLNFRANCRYPHFCTIPVILGFQILQIRLPLLYGICKKAISSPTLYEPRNVTFSFEQSADLLADYLIENSSALNLGQLIHLVHIVAALKENRFIRKLLVAFSEFFGIALLVHHATEEHAIFALGPMIVIIMHIVLFAGIAIVGRNPYIHNFATGEKYAYKCSEFLHFVVIRNAGAAIRDNDKVLVCKRTLVRLDVFIFIIIIIIIFFFFFFRLRGKLTNEGIASRKKMREPDSNSASMCCSDTCVMIP